MTVGLLLVSVLLIAANGFFVAAEFALLASRATRLEPMAEGGDDAGAAAALEAVQDLQPQLVGAQLGITMASLGLGYVAEPAVASLIESAVEAFVELPSGVLHTISFFVAMSIVVIAHMVVGEMLPKNLAIANTRTRRPGARPDSRFVPSDLQASGVGAQYRFKRHRPDARV